MIWIAVIVFLVVAISLLVKCIIDDQRKKLLNEILGELHIDISSFKLNVYDTKVTVKSRQTLDNYSDIKYIKDNNALEIVNNVLNIRKSNIDRIDTFLKSDVNYVARSQYNYVKKQLTDYIQNARFFKVLIVYITSAGNNRGERIISINSNRINEFISHPELLMTKGEYSKLIKQQTKEELDAKKHLFYDRVNTIIDFANNSRENLIVKSQAKNLDELVQKLINSTINSIQKIKTIYGEEWDLLDKLITTTDNQINKIVEDDRKISEYYDSEEFAKIKETCNLLTQSQSEFNEYINEKANSISQLFGKRIVRNATENNDVHNFIRTYKKSITPFTAEVSSTVFGSAENNPIGYIIKYFYPNKSQYTVQIDKLRVLIEELETLKEAKVIIDNYKKDYSQYIQNVPEYVMENDEDGFYSRLGLAVIDENVLNIEYRFTYTSDGGLVQRSFAVPMNEENITELINQLESKLSLEALAKEQRALMTTKLRNYIKERDNYTCCECGNSVYAEPNLLLEIDHINPISNGGLTTEDNLQTLCWKCNRRKGSKVIS